MTRPYPGNPERAVRIQAEVNDATGTIPPRMRCTCGQIPMLVSVAYGLVRVSCPCGWQGPNCRTEKRAVDGWNQQIVSLTIEALR